jgi:hypothetical protein
MVSHLSDDGLLKPNCPYGRRHPVKREQVLAEMWRVRRGCRDMGYDREIAGHNGYSLLAIRDGKDGRGKLPGSEPLLDHLGNKIVGPDGKIRCSNWREHGHSDGFLHRRALLLTNTGVVLGGAHDLAVFDIDPNKSAPDADRYAFALDILRQLLIGPLGAAVRQAPIRTRDPGSVAILIRTDRPTTKYKVTGERAGVELLAEGQFLVIHGDHKDEANIGPGRSWSWMHCRAPWNTPVDQLPVISADAAIAALDSLRAAGIPGPPIITTNTGNHGGGRPFGTSDVMKRLHELEARHDSLIRPAVRELIAEIGAAGHDRHDAHVRVIGHLRWAGWTAREVDDFLTPIVNQHFGDGDWSGEIARAYGHAHKNEMAKVAAARSHHQ